MVNWLNSFISIVNRKDGENENEEDEEDEVRIYENGEGDYNYFYDDYRNSSITYFMNPEPNRDKVFDNLMWRIDVWNKDKYLDKEGFERVRVKNEYQDTEEFKLNLMDRRNNNVKKKFRLWSLAIPRSAGTMNRIRNPWIETKFTFKGGNNKMFRLYDMEVGFTV